MGNETKKTPSFLIIQVISKQTKESEIKTQLEETGQLISTFGGNVKKTLIQRLDHPHPKYYIGKGKLEELKDWCDAENIDVVVINALVKSSQLFRIEKELWQVSPVIMVWDRIDLILNIFDQHASTIESKLQIKLARSTHMGPRIYGLGKTELSRQGGGVGTRGKGETNIEFEKRKIKVDQQKIKKELKKVLKQKHNRLKKRNALGIGPVALVGYTSAGKTTLFNSLTGKEKEMNKGLFTTLDTVVGKLKSPNFEHPILVSDTIGFISNLPPVLIDSFKSTLFESLEAKLLLHVVDANDPNVLDKIIVVEEILESLKAKRPMILVLNKADLMTSEQFTVLESQITDHFNDTEIDLRSIVKISAQTGHNLKELTNKIEDFFIKE
jgi:GTP-binding protein HflX